MTRLARWALLVGGSCLLCSCGGEDPEQELRRLLADAEAAAEARDTGHFRGLISESYRDARGNDRDRLVNLLRGYFLTHQKVEILTRIEEIAIAADDAASATLGVALVGQRSGAQRLSGFSGELDTLELELVREDGDWHIIGADWNR